MAIPLDQATSVRVEKKTKRRLKAAKLHPRETDDETVNRALEALRPKTQGSPA